MQVATSTRTYFIMIVGLLLANMAGGTLLAIPAMVAYTGVGIYVVVLLTYVIMGSLIGAGAAWLGAATHQEFTCIAGRMFGFNGKRFFALLILAVSIPASVITGMLFSGYILEHLLDIPWVPAGIVCISVYAFLAGRNIRRLCYKLNYVVLLLIPLAVYVAFMEVIVPEPETAMVQLEWDWILALALAGYSAGGMRLPLLAETGMGIKADPVSIVKMVICAKLLEGLIILLPIAVVLKLGLSGPLALSQVMELAGGYWIGVTYDVLLLAALLNVMVPAMDVNARQIALLTGKSYSSSLLLTVGLAIVIVLTISMKILLGIMAAAATASIIITLYMVANVIQEKKRKFLAVALTNCPLEQVKDN